MVDVQECEEQVKQQLRQPLKEDTSQSYLYQPMPIHRDTKIAFKKTKC